jgi:hypothetical protein
LIRLQLIRYLIKINISKYISAMLLFCALLSFLPSSASALYLQIDGVADIKSSFSEGCSSITDIASQAERQKIDVVLFGDYARNSIEYGVKPFEKIFKDIHQGPSVLNRGIGGYLSEIKDSDRKFDRTLLIPGVEAIPFYFWSGSNYDKNLIAHNFGKHLLVFGMPSAQDYEQLPLPNSNFSKKYTHEFLNKFIIISFIFLLTVWAVYRSYVRKATVPLMLFFALLALNNHPFQSSLFDPYKGDQGIKPYQNLIDYVTSKGALVFWNHMEATSGISQKDTLPLETLPYPDDLLKTQNYTGFQVVGDKPIGQTDPGQQWDQVLMEYLDGKREQPVWGIGSNDYLCENQNEDSLGSTRTIFLVRESNNVTVLDAMRKGRMYAVRQTDANRLSLDEFVVKDQKAGNQVTMGEELVATDFPDINIKLRSVKGGNKTAQIQIIRNGALVKEETVSLPYELAWRDLSIDRIKPVYYRVKAIVSPTDHLVSNPIFIKFSKNIGVDVASIPTPKFSPATSAPIMHKPVVSSTVPVKQPKAPSVAMLSGASSPKISTPSAPSPSHQEEPLSPKPISQPVLTRVTPAKIAVPAQKKLPEVKPNSGKLLMVMTNGVELKKGPGKVFSNITKLHKGEEVNFVRRTNIEFNNKNWLMVKHKNRSGYVWEGLVRWTESSADKKQ